MKHPDNRMVEKTLVGCGSKTQNFVIQLRSKHILSLIVWCRKSQFKSAKLYTHRNKLISSTKKNSMSGRCEETAFKTSQLQRDMDRRISQFSYTFTHESCRGHKVNEPWDLSENEISGLKAWNSQLSWSRRPQDTSGKNLFLELIGPRKRIIPVGEHTV